MVRIKFKRRALDTVNFLGRPSSVRLSAPLRFKTKPNRFKTKHTSPAFGSFTNIPRPTSISLFSPSMNKPALKFYGDSDGDGVMNGFDCAPNNKKLQGPQHKKIVKGSQAARLRSLKGHYPGNFGDWKANEQENRIERIMPIETPEDQIPHIYSDEDIHPLSSPRTKEEINQRLNDIDSINKIRKTKAILLRPRKNLIIVDTEINTDSEEMKGMPKFEAKESEYDYEEELNKEEGRAEKISLQRHEYED